MKHQNLKHRRGRNPLFRLWINGHPSTHASPKLTAVDKALALAFASTKAEVIVDHVGPAPWRYTAPAPTWWEGERAPSGINRWGPQRFYVHLGAGEAHVWMDIQGVHKEGAAVHSPTCDFFLCFPYGSSVGLADHVVRGPTQHLFQSRVTIRPPTEGERAWLALLCTGPATLEIDGYA